MLPAMFAAEIFVCLQSSLNAYAYNLRTRNLNNVLTNVVQIIFNLFVSWIMGLEKLGTRKRRAIVIVVFDAVWVTGTYVAQTIWLASWQLDRNVPGPAIDWKDPAYPGAVVIYLAYGAQNGFFQNTIYWLLSAMTNQPERLVHMAGLATSGRPFPSVPLIFRVPFPFLSSALPKKLNCKHKADIEQSFQQAQLLRLGSMLRMSIIRRRMRYFSRLHCWRGRFCWLRRGGRRIRIMGGKRGWGCQFM